MANVRLAVIFYSTYGTNHQMSEVAAEAARAAGADVRLLRVRETVPDEIVESQEAWKAQAEKMQHIPVAGPEDMEWANAYLFSGMTSAQNPHGGQEATLLSLYTTMMHWGTIIVAPGYTDPIQFKAGGNPYGVTVTADGTPIPEEIKEAIRHQARRLVDVARKLAA
jgi:NAD(P)H dehydrogenase (quinone)